MDTASVANAIESGAGRLEGDTRAYNCSGEFMWADGTIGVKQISCMVDGSWGTLSDHCKSLILCPRNFISASSNLNFIRQNVNKSFPKFRDLRM